MSSRKITFCLLILSLIGLLASHLILNSNLMASATGDMLVKLGKSLFYGMSALALVFTILLFTPQAIPAWKKFAIWFIPLATLLFIFYKDPGSGDLLDPYAEQVFQWASTLYVVISVFVISFSLIKQKIKSN